MGCAGNNQFRVKRHKRVLGFGEGVEREKGIHSKNISYFYECCLSKPFQPLIILFNHVSVTYLALTYSKERKNVGA